MDTNTNGAHDVKMDTQSGKDPNDTQQNKNITDDESQEPVRKRLKKNDNEATTRVQVADLAQSTSANNQTGSVL